MYEDIMCHKGFNESFHVKLESLQYNATLAITGAIRGSSTENIYGELGLKSIRWYRKMIFLYKAFKSESHCTFLILYQIVIRNVEREIQSIFTLFC